MFFIRLNQFKFFFWFWYLLLYPVFVAGRSIYVFCWYLLMKYCARIEWSVWLQISGLHFLTFNLCIFSGLRCFSSFITNLSVFSGLISKSLTISANSVGPPICSKMVNSWAISLITSSSISPSNCSLTLVPTNWSFWSLRSEPPCSDTSYSDDVPPFKYFCFYYSPFHYHFLFFFFLRLFYYLPPEIHWHWPQPHYNHYYYYHPPINGVDPGSMSGISIDYMYPFHLGEVNQVLPHFCCGNIFF